MIEKQPIVRALQRWFHSTTVETEQWLLCISNKEERTIVLRECEQGWAWESEFFVMSSGKHSTGLLLLPVRPWNGLQPLNWNAAHPTQASDCSENVHHSAVDFKSFLPLAILNHLLTITLEHIRQLYCHIPCQFNFCKSYSSALDFPV